MYEEQNCDKSMEIDRYEKEIMHIKNALLTREVELNVLKTMTSKCIKLRYEVGIDLADEIPSLQKETLTNRTLELQLYRGEIDLLLHNIIEKIGNEMEKIFSNYLTEELNNPHIQTTEKFLFEKDFRELKSLFLSIDRVL